MRKYLVLFLFFVCSLITAHTYAGNDIRKETFVYSIKGSDTLRLDKYDLPAITPGNAKPCVIFMFGGGFVRGIRDQQSYLTYFDHLVKKGYTVISIDYRLGLKNIDPKTEPMQFVSLLTNSISIAVEDLFDATSFVISNANDWNIDTGTIITSGSSAGAISVLHGEYAIANKEEQAKKLPENFNYAGVISFAGAIFSTNGDLNWQSSPAPMLLFHGDADSNVPYDKIELYNIGFYGSKHIATQLSEKNYPHYFYKIENAAHEISNTPMKLNLSDIDAYLNQLVENKEQKIINTTVKQIDKPEMKKDFELMDYIKSNFAH